MVSTNRRMTETVNFTLLQWHSHFHDFVGAKFRRFVQTDNLCLDELHAFLEHDEVLVTDSQESHFLCLAI